jgi:hypothetical protein
MSRNIAMAAISRTVIDSGFTLNYIVDLSSGETGDKIATAKDNTGAHLRTKRITIIRSRAIGGRRHCFHGMPITVGSQHRFSDVI